MEAGDMAKDHDVPIHIDKQNPTSPSHTTGAALYVLGSVATGYDLYRETRGQGDDELIRNDDSPVEVKPGEHFYTAQSSLNPGGTGDCVRS
jgi:hypothetical protein